MVKGLPHDIFTLQPYVRPLWLTLTLAGIAVMVLGALLGGVYWWYRRRKARHPSTRVKDSLELSWELIEKDLEQLRIRLANESPEEIRELFYGLSLVLRRAIELTSGIRATDLTVQEIKGRLKTQAIYNQDLVKDLVTFLTRADLIKFADALGESGEAYQSYQMVKDWVMVLKPKPSIPMPSDAIKGQPLKGIK